MKTKHWAVHCQALCYHLTLNVAEIVERLLVLKMNEFVHSYFASMQAVAIVLPIVLLQKVQRAVMDRFVKFEFETKAVRCTECHLYFTALSRWQMCC